MGRFTEKAQLLEEIRKERRKFTELLAQIPEEEKYREVVDGLTVKDLLAHRTEWGRMMLRWYQEAAAGGTPAVPTERYKWNQLKELNADIHRRFHDTPLEEIQAEFSRVHDALYACIESCSDEELFTTHYYPFTGKSDLALYFNSATASHYRSAGKLIRRWWKARQAPA